MTVLPLSLFFVYRANQEFSKPPPRVSGVRQVIQSVRNYCSVTHNDGEPLVREMCTRVVTIGQAPEPHPRKNDGDLNDLYDPRPWVNQAITVGGLAALLGASALALLLARRIATPIRAVSDAAERMAHGDLAARVPINKNMQQAGDETSRLANNFNLMAETLERQEQNRKAMIADIAHELRTPLSVMRAKFEAMEDGVIPLNQAEIGKLQQQSKLLSRLIEDLRLLSLADAGQLTLEQRDMNISELLDGIAANFVTKAKDKNLHLQTHILPNIHASVDGERISQVIGNLLENALRYTPAPGNILLSLNLEANNVLIRVSDSGPGLPQEQIAHVFDRFYRAEASRNRAAGGSGLGLAIVRAIVELHGGTAWAENQSTGGLAVNLRLPQG